MANQNCGGKIQIDPQSRPGGKKRQRASKNVPLIHNDCH